MGPGLGQIAQVGFLHRTNSIIFFLVKLFFRKIIFVILHIQFFFRYHANIQQECGIIVKTIKAEMKSDLIPLAEEKSNHGKV